MKEQAKQICLRGGGYWTIANNLRNLGIPLHRARRMARHAVEGRFLWEGKTEPLFPKEGTKGSDERH